jgi:hypothetical protein
MFGLQWVINDGPNKLLIIRSSCVVLYVPRLWILFFHYAFIWFGLWCLTPLSTIFQLYRGGQFFWWMEIQINEGPSWSWSYGGWIYNYLWNQCLSSLNLWVRTLFMARCAYRQQLRFLWKTRIESGMFGLQWVINDGPNKLLIIRSNLWVRTLFMARCTRYNIIW